MLKSQEVRKIAPEMDPLRLGMGWSAEDLDRPQVLVESTYGQSHPGSAHLLEMAQAAAAEIQKGGSRPALYFATDICDGMAQGHDGINYSMASRDTIANLIEIHAKATTFDAGIFFSSCDKSVPAQLMAIGRVNIPSILVPGGVMPAGPDRLTLEQIGMYSAMFQRGEISEEQFTFYKRHACPGCGSCSFMGTACTMQIMAEALGLTLPGAALLPAGRRELEELARASGQRAARLAQEGLAPQKMVTRQSFENAVIVHAAISGSTNTLLHLPAIAREFGVELTGQDFDQLHRGAHYLLDIRPAGRWPAEYFSYAGGVPRVMEEIKSMLHLDVMTVTGKTLGENLEDLHHRGYFEEHEAHVAALTGGLGRTDIIRDFDTPIGSNGAVAVLKGNLAPQGAVVKHSAVPKEMHRAVLRARPFDSEEEAIAAILHKKILPGDGVIIRYEGPRGSGMPEMFYTTEAIASDPELAASIALITDGRFSGASKGPAIGHLSPEAAQGGPIALVEEGDLIELDISRRVLRLCGLKGREMTEEEIAAGLAERRTRWQPPQPRYKTGVLGLYTKNASAPMLGGYMC